MATMDKEKATTGTVTLEDLKKANISFGDLKRLALERVTELRAELNELEQFTNAIDPVSRPKVAKVGSFKGWTIPQCAKQLILEAGTSLTTGQICREMLARGWETKAKRPVTVVHSGLAETPYISRVGKRWDLSKKGSETEF